MKSKKVDLRVIKTKKLLFETLINILKDKPFEEIKVSDICKEALINRSTFYSHYEDKYELLIDLINNYKDSLEEKLNENNNIEDAKEYYLAIIKIMLEHIDENRNVYQSILVNNRNSIVMDILLDEINKRVKDKLEESKRISNSIPNDILIIFYIGAVSSLCIAYLNNNKKYSDKEIIEYLNILLPDNFK